MKLNKDKYPEYEAIARKPQPMNALQPTTSVYNIGYDAPNKNGTWYTSHITEGAAKKPKAERLLVKNRQAWSAPEKQKTNQTAQEKVRQKHQKQNGNRKE